MNNDFACGWINFHVKKKKCFLYSLRSLERFTIQLHCINSHFSLFDIWPPFTQRPNYLYVAFSSVAFYEEINT